MFTTLYIDFSNAQGQEISAVSGGIWLKFKLIKLLCMSSLPARIKKLECSKYVSHYKSMELFPGAQGQLTLQSVVGAGRSLNSSEI